MLQPLRSHANLSRPPLAYPRGPIPSQGIGSVEDKVSPGEGEPRQAKVSSGARVKEALVGALLFPAPGLIATRFGVLGMLAGIAGLTACAVLEARHHHEEALLPGLAAATFAAATVLIVPTFFAACPPVGLVAAGALSLVGLFQGEHCLLQSTFNPRTPPPDDEST